MRVDALIREAKATTKVRLYNPDTKDFSVKYGTKILFIPALEIKEFIYYEAKHIKKHLVDYLIHKKSGGYVTPEERQKVEEKVEVTI